MIETVADRTLEERLWALGLVTYDEYLDSPYWADARSRWRLSGMPEECLICSRCDYNLHHRSYERIGEEPVGHLVALCEPHHYEVHRLLKARRPRVTLWDAHLHYRHWHFARRSKQPRLFGSVLSDHFEAIFDV